MQLRFTFVGKTRNSRLQVEIDGYLQRLQRYVPVEHREIKEMRLGSKEDPRQFCRRQAPQLIQTLTRDNFFRVVLTEHGRAFTTLEFAGFLSRQLESGRAGINFLAAGPYGLAAEVLEQADFQLSLSPMTFTHEMARVLLLEQLYRALTILRGEPYHY
ncbi:MAG: 23S rRNA (pseudouridine(1915)-N(3))-methyltransferase RlmH [Pseudomonadota bacterium]|nr:23S rRNA (pseudouridine(1915)-N(3))-methyltransferase RlmH [Pseudomonadota bacterium]